MWPAGSRRSRRSTAHLVVSEQVIARAGLDKGAYPRHELTVRNRLEILAIRVIPDAADLDLRDTARRDASARERWARTYDAEYVALAHLLSSRLLTLDARLRRTASRLVEVLGPHPSCGQRIAGLELTAVPA